MLGLRVRHALLKRGVFLQGLLEPMHSTLENHVVVAWEVLDHLVKVAGLHVEEDAVVDRLGSCSAPLRRQHGELAKVGAGHERDEHDRAVRVGDLHASRLEEVHAVARLVDPERAVASHQHLRLEGAHKRLDEDVVRLRKHWHLAHEVLVHHVKHLGLQRGRQ